MVLVAVEWFSVVVYSGLQESRRVGTVTHPIVRYGDCTGGTDVWATPTAQQFVNQQQMFQQSLEMQRQQPQAQIETLTNLGAAQVAKTTYDARDFQTKAFSKMKGFKGDEKAWPDRRYKFRGFEVFPSSSCDPGLS